MVISLSDLVAERIAPAYSSSMAMLFWGEPIPTYDVDVLVFMPGASGLRG